MTDTEKKNVVDWLRKQLDARYEAVQEILNRLPKPKAQSAAAGTK